MNGTVAPPSSSSTAAVTCPVRTPSSSAILWSMEVVTVGHCAPRLPDRHRRYVWNFRVAVDAEAPPAGQPFLILVTNAASAAWSKTSTGPDGFLESRTAPR